MAIKSKPCKECGSIYHTAMYHKPKKAIKRTAIKAKPVKKKVKRVSRGQLVKKLDTVYSQYIRLSNSVDGDTTCVTCGDHKPWTQHQNGHFYTRGRYATRWDDMNCKPQCVACNVFLKGNYINYTMYMIDRYGREAVDQLEVKSKSTIKLTTYDLQQMIDEYKLKTKELLNG